MIPTLVIAAAGRGTRMKALTASAPKHLIPISGRPFLSYVLQSAAAAGIERFVIVVGYQAETMRTFLATQPYQIAVVDQAAVVGDRYGTAAVVASVQQAVSDQPFLFMNGDTLCTPSVFTPLLHDDGYHHVLGIHHSNPADYGVIAATTDGLLMSIEEKPREPKSNVVNMGVYSFQQEIFAAVEAVGVSTRGEYEITDALNALAAQQRVRFDLCLGEWVDLTAPEDIPAVEQFVRSHQELFPTI